jgi:hypothetical protein
MVQIRHWMEFQASPFRVVVTVPLAGVDAVYQSVGDSDHPGITVAIQRAGRYQFRRKQSTQAQVRRTPSPETRLSAKDAALAPTVVAIL